MLMPSIFGENLFDDFFNDFPFYYDDKAVKDTEKKLYGKRASHVMKTDIKEMDNGYELVVDLPGFTKDEIKASLENGYLTISAEKGLDKDEKEKESGRYIRRERYAGACSRSFYVGLWRRGKKRILFLCKKPGCAKGIHERRKQNQYSVIRFSYRSDF